jgi:hypothetical protein
MSLIPASCLKKNIEPLTLAGSSRLGKLLQPFFIFFLLLIACLSLTGCGQTGDLYLPNQSSQAKALS